MWTDFDYVRSNEAMELGSKNFFAPVLETPRLILRGHEVKDFPASAEMWADMNVVRYISGHPSSTEKSWARFLTFQGLWPVLGYGYWVIEEKSSGAFVGEAGLADFKRVISAPVTGLPEAGWALHPRFHGKGHATEAMTAILSWAKSNLSKHEIFCIINPENKVSIRLAEKLGFKFSASTSYQDSDIEVYFKEL